MLAPRYGVLGSVDANTGDELLGWDTDQFLMDYRRATQIMKVVIEQDGLAPGGLNFDAKVLCLGFAVLPFRKLVRKTPLCADAGAS